MTTRTITTIVMALFVLTLLPEGVAHAESEAELMKQAGEVYAKRETKGKAKEAIELYQKVLAINPENGEAYWSIAAAYYWIGRLQAFGSAGQLKNFQEAIEYAKLAVEVAPNAALAHLWLAATYGAYGEGKGIMQSLHLVPYVEKELKAAIKLDPKALHGAAYAIYGKLKAKLPGFKGGDMDKAVEYCEKALAIGGKKGHMNYRFMAEVYMEKGDKEKAKEWLEKLIALPDGAAVYAPEARVEKKLAKKLLKEL